ncbi:hypothetical protein V865_001275 [Kwoniella europaea PYCC6329]|uniref:Zinc-finger domain-containing protein n=1 Tax=Kwoniella europaea PYCC6329 TaxID=1423913 RepID=A0AAX4KBB4_9TREE
MPRKKSQAKKVEVTDGLVSLLSDPSVIDIGSSVGNLTSRTSAIGALPRTITPNIHEIGRDTQATTGKYLRSKARHEREMRRSERKGTVEEKELERRQLSKTYTLKPASFEGLRIMDWSRISECLDHDCEECWYHEQINCTNYRRPSNFSHPIRYPLALGKGLEIGLCKDCKRDKCDCSVSSENDRFYGLSDSLKNPPVIHRIDTSQGKLVEGIVDMRIFVEESDGDEGKDKDEDEDKREGRKSDTPRVANATLKRGSKRRRPVDADSDFGEDTRSHCVKSNISQMNRVKHRIIISPKDDSDITLHSGNDHSYQDPNSTLRTSASLVSDSALPGTSTAENDHLDLPSSTSTIPSTSTRTLANKEVIMAKLGQVFMERDEAVKERNELAKEVDRLREILGDKKM